ncbi:MAG: hypothetical protein ACOYVF_03440 [Candidatus Zixiibacteriota bacterium]
MSFTISIDNYFAESKFLDFLDREFDKTVLNASMEKLAEFAFGGINEAIEAINNQTDKKE